QKEESSTSEQNTVPQHRFAEKVEEVKELEEKVSTLEKDAPGKLTPEQEKEQQAKEYLTGLMKEELDKRDTAKKEADTVEERKFNQDVQDALDENQDAKKADFLKFVEEQGDNFTSVKSAMSFYKQLGSTAKDAKAEGQEEERSKPDLPSSEGETEEITEAPEEDKNKSFRQVIAEAMRGAVGKSE
ncbi:hypothetical protein LCGC14_0540410, partial [marine sediment metagenome]